MIRESTYQNNFLLKNNIFDFKRNIRLCKLARYGSSMSHRELPLWANNYMYIGRCFTFPPKFSCLRKTPFKITEGEFSAVQAPPEEFEIGRFTLETQQMFYVYFAPKGFKDAKITADFGIVFEKISCISWHRCFRKDPFLKCFPSSRKRKAGVFKFLPFKERLRRALFSWWIRVDGTPNRRDNTLFSNLSGKNLFLKGRGLQTKTRVWREFTQRSTSQS